MIAGGGAPHAPFARRALALLCTPPIWRALRPSTPGGLLRDGSPSTYQQALRPAPGGFCGTVVPAAPDMRGGLAPSSALLPCMGAPPHAPGDFLAKRKSPKIRQGPPGPWTPSEGGGSKSVPLLLLPRLIPRPSALAVLVAIAQTLKHPRKHPLPRHGLTAEGVTPGVAWGEK